MSNQPDQLSQLLLEADGLLLLLHRHRDETPLDAIHLLRRKLQLILALTDGLEDEETSADDEQEWAEDTVENPTDESENDENDNHPVEDQNSANSSENTPIKENIEHHVTVNNVDPTDNDCNSDEPTTQSESENVIVQISPEDNFTEHEIFDTNDNYSEDRNNTTVESYIESTIEHATAIDPEPALSEPIMYQPVEKPVILEDEVVFMNDTPKEIERTFIDDAPIYKPRLNHLDEINSAPANSNTENSASRRPVSSVFNLNDKFRFRRELFGNSDAQYVECLDLLSAMTSIDEAKEYLYDDLSWDPDNDDVKAFVELLQNYYKY